MEPEYQDQLERLIDLELKQLPEPHAPERLLERVLKAIEEDERKPWWRKPWSCWPSTVQTLFISSLVVFAGTFIYALSLAPTDAPARWFDTKLAVASGFVSTSANLLAALANAFLLVVTALFSSWVFVALVAAAFLYASSFAVGLAWLRVSLNRRASTFKFL